MNYSKSRRAELLQIIGRRLSVLLAEGKANKEFAALIARGVKLHLASEFFDHSFCYNLAQSSALRATFTIQVLSSFTGNWLREMIISAAAAVCGVTMVKSNKASTNILGRQEAVSLSLRWLGVRKWISTHRALTNNWHIIRDPVLNAVVKAAP